MKTNNSKKRRKRWAKEWLVFVSVIVFCWGFLSKANLPENNIFEDTDQDGLTNQEELAYGTDPENADTDGDGYSDKVELESGYDPLKPAPGDKIMPEPQVAGELDENEGNITDEFLEKLETEKGDELDLVKSVYQDPELLEQESFVEKLNNASISGDELQTYLGEVVSGVTASEEIELISEDSVVIKEKPTGEEEEIKFKEKKQIEEYLTAIFYIMAVNSPVNLEEEGGISEESTQIITLLNDYILNQDLESLSQMRKNAENVYDEILKIEAPYVMKDVHILALSLANYLIENIDEKDLVDFEDPLAMLMLLGKMQGVLIEAENLQQEIVAILEEYEINELGFGDDGEEDDGNDESES